MESMECRDVERFNNELRKWQSLEDLEDFSEDIRTQLAEVPGPCVLDLSEENILSFGQGDWSLVERDIRAAFSSDLADLILNCFKDVVQTCLAVRRELINYKKLCLHMWQAGAAVEKDLRQLASFFYCELVNGKAPDARRQRYVESPMHSTSVEVLWRRFLMPGTLARRFAPCPDMSRPVCRGSLKLYHRVLSCGNP